VRVVSVNLHVRNLECNHRITEWFPSHLKKSNLHMPLQTSFCCSVYHSKIVDFSCVLSKMHKCIRQESPRLNLIASFTQSDWVNEFFHKIYTIFSLQTKSLDFCFVFIKVGFTKYFRKLSFSFFFFFFKLYPPPSGTE